jgi:hypothetical protein
MIEALATLISTQRNKPLSIVVAALALFAPASLTIFLARPDLFSSVGVNGVLLLSVCISLPIILICYGIWWTPLSALLKIVRALQGHVPETDMLRIVTSEDPLEWPCLLAGAWSANVIMFVIAAVAYFRPIKIGATFLLTAGILWGIWFLVLIASIIVDAWVRRKLKAKLEELLKAAAASTQSSSGPSGAA